MQPPLTTTRSKTYTDGRASKEGNAITSEGEGTPHVVIKIFWKLFSRKFPFNASKVPQELFDPYQNEEGVQ